MTFSKGYFVTHIIQVVSQPTTYVILGTDQLIYVFDIEMGSKRVRFTGNEKGNGMKRELSAVA
jgi:hypothetical protein